MKNLTPLLKIFAHNGRENGLMVVCAREDMRELAAKLQAGIMQTAVPSTKEWHLSFHIEGTVPAEKVVPLRRNGPPGALVLCILVLPLVSCISLVRWILNVL
jgi:hypothetical protein